MSRASFGGGGDISQSFAFLYEQYGDRLESLANRAASEARSAQAATDNDTIDKWQKGELSDAQFMAYVQKRQAESASDPEELTYWNKVARDTAQSIKADQITDTAEDIINDIEAGTKTYGDLLAFYKSQQKGLRPNDPIYKDLDDQIEEVNDRIAENKVNGDIAGIDYKFRTGSLTGKQAGAALRAQAERYRVNDPARYYQMLTNALEYEQYGGTYGAGGGGGGGGRGGSGGGSSRATLNQTIDGLQGIEDRLRSLSEQFEAGETVGSITYQDASGRLVTDELLLRGEGGVPTRDMKAVDDEMLSTLDALEAAYIEKGDLSAAGETNNRKMDFITDHIQPRNTISRENQANRLLNGLQSAVEAAANASDPVLAWGKVRAAERRIERWHQYLNRRATTVVDRTVEDKKLRENPELAAANRHDVVTDAAIEDRTTADFQAQADALLMTAHTIAGAKSVADLSGASEALVLMLGEAGASDFMQRAGAAVDLVTGIPAGKYARVFIPGEGLVFTPVAETVQSRMGPNGPESVPVRVPVGADGGELADSSRGESLDTIFMEIDGHLEQVSVISAPSYYVGGQKVSQADYESFVRQIQDLSSSEKRTASEEELLSQLQGAGAPAAYREALVPRADGKAGAVAWFQDQAGLWHKRKVTKGGGVPFIFAGKDARQAQALANQINPATGQAYDPTGRAFFNERDYQQKRNHNVIEGDGADWYDVSLRGKREEARAAERQQAVTARGIEKDRVASVIQKQASRLGINLGAPTAARKAVLPTVKKMPKMPDIEPVKPATVKPPAVSPASASLAARLSSLVTERRRRTQESAATTTRQTYAGSGFSGFQE